MRCSIEKKSVKLLSELISSELRNKPNFSLLLFMVIILWFRVTLAQLQSFLAATNIEVGE